MTFGGWQENVQEEFAIGIYEDLWPNCTVEENDSAGKDEQMAKIFDYGGVDKVIRISGLQIHMAQRFRKPFSPRNSEKYFEPDFTLRYSRPRSNKTIEHERLMNAHENGAASYPRRYSFGRVFRKKGEGLYPERGVKIYELYIINTDKFIKAIKDDRLKERGPYETKEGQKMMAYDIDGIRNVDAIEKTWYENTNSKDTTMPDNPEKITSW